ncbi:MAG: hypothetical protein WBG54_04305 [Acidobacteriaceae bacterium]
MIAPERWYDPSPDVSAWYQGDVVADIPYPFFPPIDPAGQQDVWPILRPLDQKNRSVREAMSNLPTKLIGRAAKDVTDRWALPEGEFVVAGCRKMNVMIVSRSCALDNPKRKHFLIAPVIAVDDLPEDQRKLDKLADLRDNSIPQAFYLPPWNGLRESYADLLRMVPVHRTFFPRESLAGLLQARLSSSGMAALQQTISKHFGTQYGFDEKDTCPQSGRYSCSNCFHAGMAQQTRSFEEKTRFGPCPGCGENAAWVKHP